MYGKIFDTIYDGTLCNQWEALVTFQQMIVLCDADGTLDMTPEAISRRTTIPLDIITKGIAFLEAPDPQARNAFQREGHIRRRDPVGWDIAGFDELTWAGRLSPWRWAILRDEVFRRDGYRCQYCGAEDAPLEPDHVHPVIRGGSNDLENLVTACRPCNRSKGSKTLAEWRP